MSVRWKKISILSGVIRQSLPLAGFRSAASSSYAEIFYKDLEKNL
jgi:hypothetical protein